MLLKTNFLFTLSSYSQIILSSLCNLLSSLVIMLLKTNFLFTLSSYSQIILSSLSKQIIGHYWPYFLANNNLACRSIIIMAL